MGNQNKRIVTQQGDRKPPVVNGSEKKGFSRDTKNRKPIPPK